jgi:murein DD-endopeptidase MepM/ murein hydrolase activator NlpD
MAQLYRYNSTSCRYEPVHTTARKIFTQLLWSFCACCCAAVVAFYFYKDRYGSPAEQHLAAQNQQYKIRWQALIHHLKELETVLAGVLERDNHQYRMMLDLTPLSAEQLRAGSGGAPERIPEEALGYAPLKEGFRQLLQLEHRAKIAHQSMEALHQEAQRKNLMMETRPAIQPVDNRELTRLHTTFGLRMHPIFGVLKDHKGLDFSLPQGSPVYATGNGRVIQAHYSSSYGNVVYIDHGFGYETRYAHLQKFTVHPGQYVKRGQVIGYVGNTGVSVSPHLHYEVHYHGEAVNPLHFFQRDLSSAEYLKLILKAGNEAPSLD